MSICLPNRGTNGVRLGFYTTVVSTRSYTDRDNDGYLDTRETFDQFGNVNETEDVLPPLAWRQVLDEMTQRTNN